MKLSTFFYSQVTWIAAAICILSLSSCDYELKNPDRELPELIGVYTPIDLLWLNTKTLEIKTESDVILVKGNYYASNGKYYQTGVFKTLTEALDSLEDLSAEYVNMYDAIGIREAFFMDNPFEGPVAVYIWNDATRCRQRIGELHYSLVIDSSYSVNDEYHLMYLWHYEPLRIITLPPNTVFGGTIRLKLIPSQRKEL